MISLKPAHRSDMWQTVLRERAHEKDCDMTAKITCHQIGEPRNPLSLGQKSQEKEIKASKNSHKL